MGNRSSKKKGKKLAEEEGAVEGNHPDSPKVEQDTDPFEGNDDSEKAGKSDKEKKKKGKAKKEKKKKEKKKDKKRKKSEKDKSDEKETVVSKPSIILNGDNCIDVTNFKGDTEALSEAVTVSVCVEPSPGDSMRGKENARPVTVYEGRSGRPSSPKGPGVSALMEKFGGKATGTPSRPISYPASVATRESPRTGELHREAQKKPFGFNRLDETPQKKIGSKGMADGNVSALKEKFGGTTPVKPSCTFKQPISMATPTPKTAATPATKTAATPSKFGGVANKWQPGQQSTFSTPVSSRTSVKSTFTPSTTTTTTKTTTGFGALRNRFSNNAEDNSSAKDVEETNNRNTSPEKKRKRREEEQKRAEDKENDKNRSPRRHWSPKKEPKTPSRESSPTKEASPRKRKSAVLHKFGGITRTKSREDKKKDADTAPIIQTSNKEAEEAEREKARQLILNRTSALIHGTSSTPKSTAKPRQETTKEHVTASPNIRKSNRETEEAEKDRARQLVQNRTSALIYGAKSTPKTTTPSRVQFEESVAKRTRRDERPKERPKTEYNFQSTPSSRPKSMADTNAVPSPGFYGNSSPVIGGGANIIKNPTTKTQKLLQWCQIHTQGYAGVSVSNFSSSWADGLAFCALVHKFHPTAFNYNSLNGSNRRHNLDLAFSSAEKFAKVAILLDTDDMIEMGDKPDWKCVFTYITSLYAGLTKYAQ